MKSFTLIICAFAALAVAFAEVKVEETKQADVVVEAADVKLKEGNK